MAFEVNRLTAASRECKLQQDLDKHLFIAMFSSPSPLLDLRFAVGKRFKDCIAEVIGNDVIVSYANYALDGANHSIRRLQTFIEGFQEGWKADESKPPMPDLPSYFVVGSWTHRKKHQSSFDYIHASDAETAGRQHADALSIYPAFDGLLVYRSADAFIDMEDTLHAIQMPGRNTVLKPITLDILNLRGMRYGIQHTGNPRQLRS